MKRIIKFRGLRVDGKGWVYGDLIHDSMDKKLNRVVIGIIEINKYITKYPIEVAPETVGEYTGLTDKNGVDIYEGDVLMTRTLSEELNEHSFIKYEVGFYNCSFCLFDKGTAVKQWNDGTQEWYSLENTNSFEIEITGNIHENKELSQ